MRTVPSYDNTAGKLRGFRAYPGESADIQQTGAQTGDLVTAINGTRSMIHSVVQDVFNTIQTSGPRDGDHRTSRSKAGHHAEHRPGRAQATRTWRATRTSSAAGPPMARLNRGEPNPNSGNTNQRIARAKVECVHTRVPMMPNSPIPQPRPASQLSSRSQRCWRH